MFVIRLLRWLFGWVRFEAEGGFPERLLNLAARGGMDLWGVRRQDMALQACCPARQYRRLRGPCRKSGMRMHVVSKRGAPFWIRRYRSRAGVVVGLTLFVLALKLFSQRVWAVEVRGNQKVSTDDIRAVMEQFGVIEGADLSGLDIPALQLKALQQLPDLAWCVVNLQGSVAYVEVTERVPKPQLSDVDTPSNIKAARDGRILSMEVYTGQSMVKPGDAVAQGMLLVSGVVESGKGPILRRSQAKILAETTRRLEVSIPLKETKLLPTGKEILRPSIYVFTLQIPLYTDGPIDSETALTTHRRLITVNGISLPIGMVERRYELLAYTDIVYTEEQAAALAAKRLAEKKTGELAGAQVIASLEKGELRDGRYVLAGEYQCIEDIGMEEQLVVE